ncbi:MAG TPA: AmmeMemoRadiSam system protein A [Pyrinomonadaceae bacterium]|nr:AmmeMemoRadiSam system protein A [Pyrinomonadaceae bacterium]
MAEPQSPRSRGNETLSSHLLADEKEIPSLARRAVETFVLERRVIKPTPTLSPFLTEQSSACFVTVRTTGGELRGCIGTIEPERSTLAEEIVANAINAATRDPRFLPISDIELPSLHYSVDVLYPPEPTRFEDLDPSIFGVVIVDRLGVRRGLLLPDIDGIETADQQVQIAARKAGIAPHEPHTLYRFRVQRFCESA